MLVQTIDRDFRNLIENVKAMRIYRDGHETGARPRLRLARDREDVYLAYAGLAGLGAVRKPKGFAGLGNYFSRRDFLRTTGCAAALAAAAKAPAQSTDEIVYNPGPGFYRYVRLVPRGAGREDLGDIYTIAVWSDFENKWKMAGPHKQLRGNEVDWTSNPADPVWLPSDKPTDGMDYVMVENYDVYGLFGSGFPRIYRWTRIPIEVDVNEGTGQDEVPSYVAVSIRQGLRLWDCCGLKYTREVAKGSESRLRFVFGGYYSTLARIDSGTSTEPLKMTIQVNSGRDDLNNCANLAAHELGHVLGLWSHAPSVDDPRLSTDLMVTNAGTPNAPQKPSVFNLETVWTMYCGAIPNEAVLGYSLTGSTKQYDRLYVL